METKYPKCVWCTMCGKLRWNQAEAQAQIPKISKSTFGWMLCDYCCTILMPHKLCTGLFPAISRLTHLWSTKC